MRRFFLPLCVALSLVAAAESQTNESIVPAGTLLQCTLNEPRFSSETAQAGDPVLCNVSSLAMFGRPVFPRGAYLSGRLVEFRDPGHFFGKGWLKLEFESLALPGGSYPLSAKIISAAHYRVDAAGKIHGKGHARRDAIEWAVPLLWPEKLVTLPMRGPRPTLKGETRILLKIMEDMSIPASSVVTSSDARSVLDPPLQLRSSDSSLAPGASFPKIRYGGASRPAVEIEPPLTALPATAEKIRFSDWDRPSEKKRQPPRPTILILKNGDAHLATAYWFEVDHVVYVDSDGAQHLLPLDDLDFRTSMEINWERHVPFALRSHAPEP
jgi:hypothetical protein